VPCRSGVSFVMLFVVYGVMMDAAGAGQFGLERSLAVMGAVPRVRGTARL